MTNLRIVYAGWDPNWFKAFLGVMLLLAVVVNLYVKRLSTSRKVIMPESIGVAVIGAGMAGRSHAQVYRNAQTVFGTGAPPVRLVAIADINTEFADHTRERYGFERAESDWEAIAAADDIDAVSIVVANHLHREIAEGLLAAGKHVLCEKPLAPTVADAEAMVQAAAAAGKVAACGFSYRRSSAAAAISEQIANGTLGELLHFNGRYWCDYGASPDAPTSWRYEGPLGSGALADLGSHLIDLSEQLCGPIATIQGATLPIVIKDRAVPLGAALGHAAGGAVSTERRQVTNDDIATFVAGFASVAAGTFSISRVALGHPNDLIFEVFGTNGAARFDLSTNAEFGFVDNSPDPVTNGWRARAFLDEIAGLERLPKQATFADGLHNLRIEEAIVEAAATGAAVGVEA
jgi:predicted dehydrogenase